METFSFVRQNTPFTIINDMFSRATEENSRKFLVGDSCLCEGEVNPHFGLSMLPSMLYPMGIVRSRTNFTYRRTWEHIRDNKENVVVLLYVKTGTLTLTQGENTSDLGPGEFAFIRSNVPFQYQNKPVGQQATEWSFILLPLDLVHRFFPNGIPMAVRLVPSDGQRLVMSQLMELLGAEGEAMDKGVIDLLVAALLKASSEVANDQGSQVGPRQSMGEKRLETITAYIGMHLANPELSLTMVAQACQISPRYLCHLLKEQGTSFSSLLWSNRLEKSHEWLVTLDARHYSISEIALMTGFKSAAHFSRMFRNRYGCSPREMRRGESGAAATVTDEPAALMRAA